MFGMGKHWSFPSGNPLTSLRSALEWAIFLYGMRTFYRGKGAWD